MLLGYLLLTLLALTGHTAFWTTFVNQFHATRLPKPGILVVNVVGLGSLCALPIYYAWWLATQGFAALNLMAWPRFDEPTRLYFFACAALGCIAFPIWLRRRLRHEKKLLQGYSRVRHDMVARLGFAPLGDGLSRIITQLPGNECYQLEQTEKQIELSRLAPQLDGLSISHLSDIHFAGAIDKRFFVEVMDMTNALDSDLILITGDLVDKAACIDWVGDTFGRLRARYGVYVIFGNHDVRLKQQINHLRQALIDAGLHYLGRRWTSLEIEGTSVVLAGNELPWIQPAADMRTCPPRCEDPESLRILLSHSPDQYRWARDRDFDLMLAGHNHGGQIQLPVVGPLFSPSRYGVRYACGTFYESPTVLHVSRGVSALDPLRYNCPPELARLVLRCPRPKREPLKASVPRAAASGVR